jgi:hypothetical protein
MKGDQGMLTLTVLGQELFDEETQEFSNEVYAVLELEHSLVSLSKWESKYEKPFLGPGEKSTEEVLGYVEAMTLTTDFPPDVFHRLSDKNMEQVNVYLESKQTGTWFNEEKEGKASTETITSELIYYWLVAHQIPFEVENWNLNRLFTLIKICNIKNAKPKKMGRGEMLARNRALNEQRLKQLGTSG